MSAIPLQEFQAVQKRCEEFRAELKMIARMKVFPDDQINRTTLLAAIKIARRAVGETVKVTDEQR